MSERKFHRNHAHHVHISETLSDELKEAGQDMLNQISNLDPKMCNHLLLKVINRIVGDILYVIPDIQEVVIKCEPGQPSIANLIDVVKKLTQFCNEIVQEYDSSTDTLKDKLLVFVKKVILEADDLLNIIKKEDLYDFDHELVECLTEIVFTFQINQAVMKIQNYTEQQLKDAVNALQKEHFDEIADIGKCSSEIVKDVVLHIKHTVKHCFQMAYYFNKVASNYEDSAFQDKLLESANLLNIASNTYLLECEKMTNTQEAIATLKNGSKNCWGAVIGLLHFMKDVHVNEKTAENLKDIAIYTASYGFVLNKQLGKSVLKDGVFA